MLRPQLPKINTTRQATTTTPLPARPLTTEPPPTKSAKVEFFIRAGLISDQSPVVGVMQSNAWPNEVALDNNQFVREWESKGLVPLVPFFNSGPTAMFCSSPTRSLDQIDGDVMSVGGAAQSHQVDQLGASPVSVPYGEVYESLSRGVVHCAVTPPGVAVLGGLIPSAPHVVIDPNAGFVTAPGGYAFSKARWDELPLLVRQLFWDRLEVFIGQNVVTDIWPGLAETAVQARDNGGAVLPFENEARERLNSINAEALEELRSSDAVSDPAGLIDSMLEAAAQWKQLLSADLGYPIDVSFDSFDEWHNQNSLDIDPYLEALSERIFAAHRPS